MRNNMKKALACVSILCFISVLINIFLLANAMEGASWSWEKLQEDFFDKKMKCASLNIDSDVKNNWWKYANDYSIDEIFYSPIMDTCMWVVTLFEANQREVWLYDMLSKDWFLTMFLNNKWNCNRWDESLDTLCIKQSEVFENKLEELKSVK